MEDTFNNLPKNFENEILNFFYNFSFQIFLKFQKIQKAVIIINEFGLLNYHMAMHVYCIYTFIYHKQQLVIMLYFIQIKLTDFFALIYNLLAL